jgi:hypothetical protein
MPADKHLPYRNRRITDKDLRASGINVADAEDLAPYVGADLQDQGPSAPVPILHDAPNREMTRTLNNLGNRRHKAGKDQGRAQVQMYKRLDKEKKKWVTNNTGMTITGFLGDPVNGIPWEIEPGNWLVSESEALAFEYRVAELRKHYKIQNVMPGVTGPRKDIYVELNERDPIHEIEVAAREELGI